MYHAWTNPKTLSIVSRIAGVDLVPAIDIEIGNINISVQDPLENYQKQENQSDDDIPVTKWHHDSYPFVCVVMMSDASKMVGGETAIRTGSGEIIKVRGPQMVRLLDIDRLRMLRVCVNIKIGLWCRPSRQTHHTPGISRSRWERAYHNGDSFQTS